MTEKQMSSEIKYQASISPFRSMLKKGLITTEEFHVIDKILQEKYNPIFVDIIYPNRLDIHSIQS